MSGDLYGSRITFSRMLDGDSVKYEFNDGSTHAVVANNLNIEEKSRKISFEVKVDKDLHSIVNGLFSVDREVLTIKGMLFDEDLIFDLHRIRDFGAAFPICPKR